MKLVKLHCCQSDYNNSIIDMQQEQPEEAEVFEPLPEFGEVQGEKIKLSGLDYSLIQQETAKQKKSDLLARIKNKLGEFSHRVPVNQNLPKSSKTAENDQASKSIQLISSLKAVITPSTFYLFPTAPNFSPPVPETITRRFGKMHSFPLYIRHEEKEVELFARLVVKDDRIKQNRRQRQQEAAKVVPELASEDDSDDIFGGEQESSEEVKGPLIKIGNKLNFGVDDSQIFGGSKYNKEQKNEEAEKVVEKDKYQFLRKRVKPNEEGYQECYIDNGPSLEEMRQLKKAGIEIFGEAKEFVQKQRKYNVHKDYEKIKRIIDEKNKK